MREPSPDSIKSGVPPTPRKALTGELTPPGITFWARANKASDLGLFINRPGSGSSARGLRNHANFRNDTIEEELHDDFVDAAVEAAQEAVSEAEIGLRAGEQILHKIAEALAALHEMDHALGHRAEREIAQEDALGEH